MGLSPRAWGVLSTLVESGPLTQIELATATATDRTAMTYLLDELERDALLERVRNPDDRRSYLIHLTPQGKQTQAKAAADLAKQADTLLKPLTAAGRKVRGRHRRSKRYRSSPRRPTDRRKRGKSRP